MPIIKVLSRGSISSFESTLSYITQTVKGAVEPILHNLRSDPDDHKGIVDEFIYNERFRKETANRVYAYHVIISLSELDSDKATPEMLGDIARRYLELRNNQTIAFCVPHMDTQAKHVHILMGGSLYRSGKASSMRKKELTRIKQEIERFTREKFPELNSSVEHGKYQSYIKENEYQLLKRTGQSERQTVKTLVQEAFEKATSKAQFLEFLLDKGYASYERTSGQLTGIVSITTGRKFRFSTLGIKREHIQDLATKKEKSREKKLLEKLQNIRSEHANERQR